MKLNLKIMLPYICSVVKANILITLPYLDLI